LYFVQVFAPFIAYRDKKVVGVFVRFSTLQTGRYLLLNLFAESAKP
jgi:hypothetical protein